MRALWKGLMTMAAVTGAMLAIPGTSAFAAGSIEQIDVPSAVFNVTKQPAGPVPPGADRAALPLELRATVLLPAGYRTSPRKRYPVLYLLHGAAEAYDHWAAPGRGDIAKLAAGFPGIIVMPEGGALGFYSDWWEQGRRDGAKWETYYRDELIPAIERRYRIRPQRRWHAIAGLSMGGYGAMYLAGQLPGYFGSASSYSGSIDNANPQLGVFLSTTPTLFGPGVDQDHLWGPTTGWYAVGHNPTKLVSNLAQTRLFVAYGTGVPCPGDSDGSDADGLGPNAPAAFNPPLGRALYPPLLSNLEILGRDASMAFVASARAAAIPVTVDAAPCGTHWWETWRRAFRLDRQRGFFEPVAETASKYTYTTTAQRGQAWDLTYARAERPTGLLTLVRSGRTLKAEGTGRLTITTRDGCTLTATAPFKQELPDKECRRAKR